MKRLTALFLALLMALSLCACGGGGDAHVGKYTCTSIVMNDIDLGAGDEWIELQADGKASLYMSGQTYAGDYTLEEGAFTLTIDGQESGVGTLADGVLTMELLGLTCVFEQAAEE